MITKALEKIIIGAVRFYKRFISPLHRPCCRFYPTCSDYAVLAVKKYGPLIGLAKTVWRILRCNPFGKGGIDFP